MLYGVQIRATQDLAVIDWAGAMRCNGNVLDVPAADEDRCRARVRLVTERAFRFPLEPMTVTAKPEYKFAFSRELPLIYNFMVSAWVVNQENNSDEARAMIWDALDEPGVVRVASVDGSKGFCEVCVGVIARNDEHAEGLARNRLTQTCEEYGFEFVPYTTDKNVVLVKPRYLEHFGFCG